MNFFENELRNIVKQSKRIKGEKYVGRNCFCKISNNLTLKFYFSTGMCGNEFTRLSLELINRNESKVDVSILNISEVLGINMYIYFSNSTDVWWRNCNPTLKEYKGLAQALDTYISCFTD